MNLRVTVRRRALACCLCGAWMGGVAMPLASALTLNGLEIPVYEEIGTGSATAYLLVDFGGATPAGDAFLFAYHFDGTPTAAEMMQAVDDQGLLDVQYVDFGDLGVFVSAFSVGPQTDQPDFNVDERFWVYWNGEYSSVTGGRVTWSFAEEGIRDRFVSDGSLDGWYASTGSVPPEFAVTRPRISDLNRDRAVDAADAGLLFAQWGAGEDLSTDLNRDQFVDASDAGILFAEWTGDAAAVPEGLPSPGWVLALAGSLRRLLRRRVERREVAETLREGSKSWAHPAARINATWRDHFGDRLSAGSLPAETLPEPTCMWPHIRAITACVRRGRDVFGSGS